MRLHNGSTTNLTPELLQNLAQAQPHNATVVCRKTFARICIFVISLLSYAVGKT